MSFFGQTALALLLAVFLTGCDAGSPAHQALDTPAPHLIDVTLYGVDASGNTSTITLTPANPTAPMSDRIQTTSSVRLRFDRFMLPEDAIRQSICLMPSPDPVATLQECTKGAFLEPSYDPVRRIVTYRLAAMDTLVADAKYWLTVLAPTDESPFGFRAFDGARFESSIVLQFTTAVTNPPGGPIDPSLDDAAKRTISEELFCVSNACVTACGTDDACKIKCPVSTSLPTACASCHGPIESGAAVMGLDLSDAGRISAIIGRVAHQTQTGAHADSPDTRPRQFGRAMPHIDPGNAGNSYLLYKMLVGPTHARSAAASDLAHDEIERLRASVVVGLPMPPYDFLAIHESGIDALSTWISTGARTPTCP